MGTAFSSILSHNKMISEMSGDKKGNSKSRKILLTVPKFNFIIADFLSGGRGGTNSVSAFDCRTPRGIVLRKRKIKTY